MAPNDFTWTHRQRLSKVAYKAHWGFPSWSHRHYLVKNPQGSILSPFLWNILLESLFLLSFSFDFIINAYADDILLCATSVLAHLAVSNLQLMCNSVVDWGLNSKLSSNALKTVFMVFSRKQFDRSAFCLVINNVSIPHFRECRYLGLIIDEKLNWRAHIAKICTEATKTFNTIKRCFRLSWGLLRSKLLLLYNAVIIPKISYCYPSWVSATKFSWCRKKFRSFQWPIATTSICRAFKSTSGQAGFVLASTTPLDLKLIEITCNRFLAGAPIPVSSSSMIAILVEKARADFGS
jgi:hypothetical protein